MIPEFSQWSAHIYVPGFELAEKDFFVCMIKINI